MRDEVRGSWSIGRSAGLPCDSAGTSLRGTSLRVILVTLGHLMPQAELLKPEAPQEFEVHNRVAVQESPPIRPGQSIEPFEAGLLDILTRPPMKSKVAPAEIIIVPRILSRWDAIQ
jgi:hypothetical protein